MWRPGSERTPSPLHAGEQGGGEGEAQEVELRNDAGLPTPTPASDAGVAGVQVGVTPDSPPALALPGGRAEIFEPPPPRLAPSRRAAIIPGMNVEVVLLPRDLRREHLDGRVVVVFDVLRATTSMAAALAAGVKEIRIFDDLDSASRAAAAHVDASTRLLCGEENCLPPAGFDLGNSPGAFSRALHAGRTAYMSTTNGTRAIVAAREAPVLLTGALVNAAAVARAVVARWPGTGVTLLCAGTGGAVAMEDVLGAGAVMDALSETATVTAASDLALMTRRLFRAARDDLREALAESRGGCNVITAGLGADIDFAAGLNSLNTVCFVVGKEPLAVKALAAN